MKKTQGRSIAFVVMLLAAVLLLGLGASVALGESPVREVHVELQAPTPTPTSTPIPPIIPADHYSIVKVDEQGNGLEGAVFAVKQRPAGHKPMAVKLTLNFAPVVTWSRAVNNGKGWFDIFDPTDSLSTRASYFLGNDDYEAIWDYDGWDDETDWFPLLGYEGDTIVIMDDQGQPVARYGEMSVTPDAGSTSATVHLENGEYTLSFNFVGGNTKNLNLENGAGPGEFEVILPDVLKFEVTANGITFARPEQ